MASEGSCTIGGNLATNAGGVAVLAYGTARNLVLGLEVVTAEGEIWDGLKALKKDNTGYDLKDLFIGSEGTLGIITAATLKLFPAPREKATALAAVPRIEDLLPLFRLAADEAGVTLTAFEFFSERALSFVARHAPGARLPFAAAPPWSVLLEISGMEEGRAESLLERILATASERGLVIDAVIARSLTQAKDLWHLREAMSEAQKGEGGSIKHDVSVPTPKIAEFITRAAAVVERVCPGARPVPFGHFGDGNVHYNVSQPAGMNRARYLHLWEPMSRAVHELVAQLGGSISAEHGIGRLKRAELPLVKGAVELDMMRRIKAALDPNGILNPGKLL
jgi:FAD/FMN-containing dehydrogenase